MPGTHAGIRGPLPSDAARSSTVLAGLLIAGCVAGKASWRAAPTAERVEVFYATDRDLDRSASGQSAPATQPLAIRFGGERCSGPLSFGRVQVRLPAEGPLGTIPEVTTRGTCAIKADHACLAAPVAEDEDRFAWSLRHALARSGSNDVLVFVHGYNFKFDEAVLWAAQLKHDVGFAGVVVLYSWPSHGSRWSYAPDLVNSEWTSPHLARFLDRLAGQVREAHIHLLAHSMGSRAVLSALHALAVERRASPPPRFGQVIFAAPDVDAGVFGQSIPPVLAIAERVTLYTAADLALRFSGWLFAHPRAGDSRTRPVLLDGVDTVDVTSADESRMRHNYFLENERVLADIFQLLSYGAPPNRRFRLFSAQLYGFIVWQFRS
jgi:esterase/lipase superfamily enzyme